MHSGPAIEQKWADRVQEEPNVEARHKVKDQVVITPFPPEILEELTQPAQQQQTSNKLTPAQNPQACKFQTLESPLVPPAPSPLSPGPPPFVVDNPSLMPLHCSCNPCASLCPPDPAPARSALWPLPSPSKGLKTLACLPKYTLQYYGHLIAGWTPNSVESVSLPEFMGASHGSREVNEQDRAFSSH